MKHLVTVLLFISMVAAQTPNEPDGLYVEVYNKVKRAAADLYVDGRFACHASAGGACTAPISKGKHKFRAEISRLGSAEDTATVEDAPTGCAIEEKREGTGFILMCGL